jgi:hypothetical protein
MVMPGWQASLAEVTLPHLKRYAEKIGADLNVISQRRFPDWPLSFEKHQIFEAGKDYDWNLYFDVDVLIHPDMDDFTLRHPSEKVGNWWYQDVRGICEAERMDVFREDGRYYGVPDCFVATSRKTHGLWTPLGGNFDHYIPLLTTDDRSLITTFSLSFNLARYKYPIGGVLQSEGHLVYLGFNGDEVVGSREDAALAQLRQWGIAPVQSSVPSTTSRSLASVVLMNLPSAHEVSSEMKKSRGVAVDTKAASLEELVNLVNAIDPIASLVVAVPPAQVLNEEAERNMRQFLDLVCNRKSPVVLVSGCRFASSKESSRGITAWNLRLMELAAEFDVGFLDLDLLVSAEGLGAMYSSPGSLSPAGVSILSQYLISVLENKIFSA